MEKIYVDHAATSPTHPAVADKMLSYMTASFGNPSSIHHFGRESRRVIDNARATIANSIHALPNEIIFTSGGTEGDNLAIVGAANANRKKGNHIITTQIEHHAVLNTCETLESNGFDVTYLPVDENGMISIKQLEAAITDETILVSIMYANNEVGAIQPIAEIGKLLQERDILFHTDAVQAYGLMDINVNELQVDLLTVSGHKINGPKGIGFLYCRQNVSLSPQSYGGEQERKRRAGTENVPAIVGMEEAVQLMVSKRVQNIEKYNGFRSQMIDILKEEEVQFFINGKLEHTLPNILNISFPGTTAESILMNLDIAGIAASSGSACTAGALKPSHVLIAMYGEEDERIKNAIRFSFGMTNTEQEILKVAKQVSQIVKRITK